MRGSETTRPDSGPADESGIDSESVRQALAHVIASSEFQGADRLQGFLTYVVEETLAGRGDRIRAKTIVEDVYGRSPGKGRDPMAVVRVDAGRLRRRLTDYYAGSGAGAAWQIHIDAGGYAPRFEQRAAAVPDVPLVATHAAQGHRRRLVALVGGIAALSALLWITIDQTISSGRLTKEERRANDVREALFHTSPAKLQAANLAEQARALLYPALDAERLSLVLALFERATELDPNYFGGYAGSAQALAIIAITTPPGPKRTELAARADRNAVRALELAPDEGWSHSAAAIAGMAQRDYDGALGQSTRALKLAPDDPWVRNVDALIALFSGQFERAIRSADPDGRQTDALNRFPYRNVVAAANYHLGNFAETIRGYNEAAREGDPISAISLSYIAAAQQRLGDTDAALEMLGLMEKAWPGYPVEGLFLSLFRDRDHAREIIAALEEAARAAHGPDSTR